VLLKRKQVIKSNITKHITSKLFYPHKLQKSADINILQVKLCNNLIDLFTKSLPTTTFEKYVHEIDETLRDLQGPEDSKP
jgi:hypothetical protein